MDSRISMVTLGVSDLEKSVEFYEIGLGFPRMKSEPGIAFFTLKGTWLGLYPLEALAEDAGVSVERSGFSGITFSHNVDSEAEVDQVFQQALNAGATQVKIPQKVFWGGYSGYIKDRDDYLWEIAYNPFTWIGPEKENA